MGSKEDDKVFDGVFDNSMRYVGSTTAANNVSTWFNRVYRDDGGISQVLSFNLDPKRFWSNRYNLVTMNFQMHDKGLYENLKFFKNSSFVLMDSPTI